MFFDVRNTVDFMRMIYAYPTLPAPAMTSLEYLANTTLAMFAHYTNAGLAAALLGWGKTELSNFREVSWGPSRKGNNPVPPMADLPPPQNEDKTLDFKTVLSDELKNRPQFMASNPLLISDRMLDYVLEIGEYVREKGAVPIIVQPPAIHAWDWALAFVEKFRSRCGEARLLDFSDPTKFPNLYGNLQYWADGGHLSGVGAVVWSKLLAARFADLLRQGIASVPLCKHALPSSAP